MSKPTIIELRKIAKRGRERKYEQPTINIYTHTEREKTYQRYTRPYIVCVAPSRVYQFVADH